MTRNSLQIQATNERWQEAQNWEKQFWVNTERSRNRFGKGVLWGFLAQLRLVPPYQGDDWNDWWKEQFDDYKFLPDYVENAIELGCGPYSNMRLILEACVAGHIVLSDPLVKTYVRFRNGFVARMYREGFVCIDDHAIEDCPFAKNYFELVVMTNVLDHVRDARLCVEKAVEITKPGGILILGQDLSNDEDVAAMKGSEGEIGHPIKIDHDFLDLLLRRGFTPLKYQVLPREKGRAPAHHYGTYIFAGRKLI